MRGNALGVSMHGVDMNLTSNNTKLIAYAKEHLHALCHDPVEQPQLRTHCVWSEGEWNPAENPFSANGHHNILGKRMLGDDSHLIWLDTLRMKGLQLRFQDDGAGYQFDVHYKFHLKKEKLEKLPEYEYKRYFSLMSYLVYYPIMWYLEAKRGWTTLHASALSHSKGAILIGGLGGVGKTTTCIALMQHAGLPLISENIIFVDGAQIYPCYEPIRLDAGSLSLLGQQHAEKLSPMAFPEGLKEKWLFHTDPTRAPGEARPAALFLPVFSPRRYVNPIAPEIAAEKMLAMNRLTRELDDYGWYAAALGILWPQPGMFQRRAVTTRAFAESTRCFELGIDRNAGVEAVVEDIIKTVEAST